MGPHIEGIQIKKQSGSAEQRLPDSKAVDGPKAEVVR